MSLYVGSAVFVSGDTIAHKDTLKAMNGSWCGPLKGWIFPESKRAAVLEALGDAVSEGSAPEAPPLVPSKNANATLVISSYKKAILVTGDTREVMPQIKGLGGTWNRGLQAWLFPASKKDAVMSVLEEDETNTVTEGERQEERPKKKAKKECAQESDDEEDDD